MMQKKRAVYAVYGETKYLAEAAQSARSMRKHDPDCEILAFASKECVADLDTEAFDQVVPVDLGIRDNLRLDFAIKLEAIKQGLSDYTLFMDTDTLVCGSLDEAWALLERFDVLACHAPYRRRLRYENFDEPTFVSSVPSAFSELNTGVVFFRGNPRTRWLVDAWCDLYEREPSSGDQYLFMDAVYRSACRLYVLPSEYNYRSAVPGFACDPVKIVHGRHPNIESVAVKLNSSARPRVSIWKDGQLELAAPQGWAFKRP